MSKTDTSARTETAIKTEVEIGFTSGFQNIIIQGEKGGIRKTSMASVMVDIALSMGAAITAFEIDQRAELSALYPGVCQHVIMPETERVQDDDHAEIRVLSPVLKALTAQGAGLVVLDVGANLDARVAVVMAKTGIAGRAASAGRETAFVIPFFLEASSIQSAASSARRAELAMPQAKIQFCLCETGGGAAIESFETLPAWKSGIQPHVDRHGMMRMPRLTPSILAAYKASKVSPLAFIGMSEEELSPFSDNDAFIAGANKAAMQLFVATMAEAFSTHLGFRRS